MKTYHRYHRIMIRPIIVNRTAYTRMMDLTVSIEKRRHAFLCLRSLSVDQLSDQLLFLRYAIAAAVLAAVFVVSPSASALPVFTGSSWSTTSCAALTASFSTCTLPIKIHCKRYRSAASKYINRYAALFWIQEIYQRINEQNMITSLLMKLRYLHTTFFIRQIRNEGFFNITF